MLLGFVRMSIWPGENEKVVIWKTGEGGSRCPDTSDVKGHTV